MSLHLSGEPIGEEVDVVEIQVSVDLDDAPPCEVSWEFGSDSVNPLP